MVPLSFGGHVGYFIRIEGDYRDFNKFPSRTITEIEGGSLSLYRRTFEEALMAHDFTTRADSREVNARRSYHSALIYKGGGAMMCREALTTSGGTI